MTVTRPTAIGIAQAIKALAHSPELQERLMYEAVRYNQVNGSYTFKVPNTGES